MEVKFKYNLYDRVKTPLVDNGIITMLGFDDGGNTYYVSNNVEGVAEKWWNESKVTTVLVESNKT